MILRPPRHPRPAPLTTALARSLVEPLSSAGELHRRGHRWAQRRLLPSLRLLEASRRLDDRRLAAKGYLLFGHVHDLNGAPRAAVRAYQKSARLDPHGAAPWRAIGCMLENVGELLRARHALLRARALDPRDELCGADLERVEWAIFHPVAPLYDPKSTTWPVMEALAAGRWEQALADLGNKRTIRVRQLRARVHGAHGDTAGVVREWSAIARLRGPVQLQHGDWYYVLQGGQGDDPALWRLMLWQIRPRLDGGSFAYSPTLWRVDVPEPKRFELFARCQLARCERDLASLLALAGKYPSWREPGELALRLQEEPLALSS